MEQQLRKHGGTLLAWLIVLVIHGLVLLALTASGSRHAPPGKRMQLYWIPVDDAVPPRTSAGAATQVVGASEAVPVPGPPRDAPAPRRTTRPRIEAVSPPLQRSADATGVPAPVTADVFDQHPDIEALRLQLRSVLPPVPSRGEAPRFDGGLGQVRLPGSDVARAPGLVVRDPISLDQRVQGILAFVGLGRIDPCPDIRRHVRSAIEARDPEEVSYWTDRERRCR